MAYDINKTLEQMEESLKNVDSARKQVENTVNASNELTQTVNKHMDVVKKLYNEAHKWQDELKQLQMVLSSQTQDVITNLDTSCDTISKSFKTSTEGTLERFNTQNVALAQRVKELHSLCQEVKSAMAEVSAIKDALDNIADDLTKSHKELNEALANIIESVAELPATIEGYIENTAKQLIESNQAIDRKIGDAMSKSDLIIKQIDTLAISTVNVQTSCGNIQSSCNNISSSINDVKNSIVELQDSTIKSLNINRWIFIVGFIIIVILHFI